MILNLSSSFRIKVSQPYKSVGLVKVLYVRSPVCFWTFECFRTSLITPVTCKQSRQFVCNIFFFFFFKFHSNLKRIKGTLHEDQYILFIISLSVLLRMRNVSDKSCRENQNTNFVFSNFLRFENRAKMWKNIVEQGRPQMKIWRVRIACWIPKAINTHTHVV
jgi:hypothetical protein